MSVVGQSYFDPSTHKVVCPPRCKVASCWPPPEPRYHYGDAVEYRFEANNQWFAARVWFWRGQVPAPVRIASTWIHPGDIWLVVYFASKLVPMLARLENVRRDTEPRFYMPHWAREKEKIKVCD